MRYYSFSSGGVRTKDFDIRHTIESAQPLTFLADYDQECRRISYPSGRRFVNMQFHGTKDNGSIGLDGDSSIEVKREIVKRFRLTDNMERLYSEINTDAFMDEAIRRYHGMRLTLNDPWETTVCFIISQFNNVKRIRRIVRSIIDRYGEHRDGFRSFPSSETLKDAAIRDLMACGTGFRARYIKEAAEYCTDNFNLGSLRNKSYDRVKDGLIEISGVGDKVADCIALFGYGKLEAFPIDVWVKRTLERIYFDGKERSIKELHRFAEEKFGGYQGFAQQYIFWNGRQSGRA